jgi:hypothetical protein
MPPAIFLVHGAALCAAPNEVFPTWRRAQLEVDRLAREPAFSRGALRTTGFMPPELAQRVAAWYTGKLVAPSDAVRDAYRALEGETRRLFAIIRRPASSGGLDVTVRYVRDAGEPIATPASCVPSFASEGR